MKSVSFLKSWRKRATSKTKDDDGHLPLQYPIDLASAHAPSPSPTPSHLTSSSGSAKPPTLPLSSPFRETFSHSVEEALQHHRGPAPRFTPNRRSRSPHHPTHESNTSAAFLSPPPQTPLSPRYPHNTYPVVTPQAPAAIPPALSDSRVNSAQYLQSRTSETSTAKVRSPTHDKFNTSVDIVATSPQHSKLSFTQASNTHDSHVEARLNGLTASVSPSRHAGLEERASHQRRCVSTKEEIQQTLMHAPAGSYDAVDARSRRGLATIRSTPHLRPESQYPFNCNNPLPPLPPLPTEVPSPSDPNFASLFPAPPPLIIRKKRPQPLVLHPKTTSPPLAQDSPNYSSPDSTPVATPQSSRTQFPATISPPAKASLGRKASVIPPPVYSPPTSPLPSPPSIPPPPRCVQPPTHLKSSRSAVNLRASSSRSSPTHRMTSSDPISEVAAQPTKGQASSPLKLDSRNNNVRNSSRPPDRREGSRSVASPPQEGSVQWGYAL